MSYFEAGVETRGLVVASYFIDKSLDVKLLYTAVSFIVFLLLRNVKSIIGGS